MPHFRQTAATGSQTRRENQRNDAKLGHGRQGGLNLEGFKVLGILGSPRRGGNSEILLDEALRGAKSQGAEAEKAVLNDLRISPCQGCDKCFQTGKCVINDDMEIIYEKLRTADALILASPIYFSNVTAQTKLMIDRCQCFWARKYLLHIPSEKKQRGIFISVGSMNAEQFLGAIRVVRFFFNLLDIKYNGEVLFSEIEAKGEIKKHPTACQDAFNAGARLVVEKEVAEEFPMPISMMPIGVVRNKVDEKPPKHCWENAESEIVLNSDLGEALDGIEEFSHLIILYWLHKVPSQTQPSLKTHPQGRADLPLVGTFATRSPYRPNRLGLTTVRLLERKENILTVSGLDALNDSPVVDIKPYFPGNPVTELSMPQWATKIN